MIHVVLVEPQIPPNTGNIARLCAGLSLPLHLVRPLGFKLTDRYLKRAGLDYWPHVDLHVHESWKAFREEFSRGNFYYLTTKSKRPYTSVEFKKGDFLVFGSETKGLPASLLKENTDRLLTIPIDDNIRSFNLSSAVAMVVGEAVRQIRQGPS
ncbi:MAG: tRNA (cytidine(34)-2'-O)-methyltransferase [Deltaproteobacteria bacterium]|nr:tRNA (cytidine(34)-2'-O)-methyltransferase [Deltaproteobacteria bacterium]